MTKDIEVLAASLGKAIKEDPRIDALEKAKTAYETDAMLQAYLSEFDTQQAALQEESAKPSPDRLLIAKIQGRIDELYKIVMNNSVFAQLSEAQQDVNELMESVNNIITYNITGELPSCTHDCSSCGGSCHH